jgi:hypothetical protein
MGTAAHTSRILGEKEMRNKGSMLAVFSALMASVGGQFELVKNDGERKRHNPPPTRWMRWASGDGYRVVHGTRYRTWKKASKKQRRAERLAALKLKRAA